MEPTAAPADAGASNVLPTEALNLGRALLGRLDSVAEVLRVAEGEDYR